MRIGLSFQEPLPELVWVRDLLPPPSPEMPYFCSSRKLTPPPPAPEIRCLCQDQIQHSAVPAAHWCPGVAAPLQATSDMVRDAGLGGPSELSGKTGFTTWEP